MAVLINFTEPEDFLNELRRDGGAEKGPLRRTMQFIPDKQGLPLHGVQVVATYLNDDGNVVRLRRFVGTIMGQTIEDDNPTIIKASELLKTVKDEATKLGMTLLPGIFQVTDE